MTAVTSTQRTGVPPQVPSIPLSPERPTPPQDQSIGHLVKDATAHLSTLVRSEVELAKSEVVSEARKALKGSVFFLAALTVALFSLFFLFFAIAETLDVWLPRWAAFTIVFVAMLLAAGGLGLLGWRRMKSIQKPERTINSLQETAQLARRRNGDDHDD